jgi:hypothetical protein
VDFVADTHALVFHAADQQRKLGRKARAHFEAFEAGEAVLYVLTPVVIEDVFRARALAWDHPDFFDRMIVATTLRLELPLVTADVAITELGLVKTRW